jgi:hypothetical protein
MNLRRVFSVLIALSLLTVGAVAWAQEAEPTAVTCEAGNAIQVEWNGTWYDATILAGPNEAAQCQIHYDGWDATWDEWVGAERMRHRGICVVGNAIQVLWNDAWYNATVLSGTEESCLITYDGYDSTWDEPVGPDRMRPRPAE